MRTSAAQRILCGLLFLFAAQAQAQNLLTDSGFASGISTGWVSFGSSTSDDGTRTWSSDDIVSNPASGSAEFAVQAGEAQIGLSQCVAITAGTVYDYTARIKFPTGQTAGGARAVMDIAFFASGDCSAQATAAEGMGAVIGTAYPLDDATWPGIPGNAGPSIEGSATAPAGTQTAQVRIYVEQHPDGFEDYRARFDEVAFHDAGTVPVTLQSFEVE